MFNYGFILGHILIRCKTCTTAMLLLTKHNLYVYIYIYLFIYLYSSRVIELHIIVYRSLIHVYLYFTVEVVWCRIDCITYLTTVGYSSGV